MWYLLVITGLRSSSFHSRHVQSPMVRKNLGMNELRVTAYTGLKCPS